MTSGNKKVTVKQEPEIGEIVYPSWQAATLAQEMATRFIGEKNRVVWTGLDAIDSVLNPFFPGYLVSILGRPQNAKTFMGMYILQHTMNEIIAAGPQDNQEVCILISTEVPVEIAALQWMARISGIPVSKVLRGEVTPPELKQLNDSAYKIIGLPLFIIGNSVERGRDNRRKKPNLSPKRLDDAFEYILNNYRDPETDSLIEVRLIVTDYLQRLHNDTGKKPTEFYSECVDWAKDIGTWAGAAHILNVQAGRQVDDRAIKIPTLSDGQWTSNIEQSSDTVFSVHMPKVYNIERMPELSSWGIPELIVNNSLIYFAMLKQKDGEANKCWVYEGEMGKLKLRELELDRYR